MRLSGLQRFILVECYNRKIARNPRKMVHSYYANMPRRPEDVQHVVTKSLERLIDKGLLIGFGRRTPKKWFIEEIKLTHRGRVQARKLLGEQLILPLAKPHHSRRP